MADALRIWSIGHSNHSMERLVELLRASGIEVVVDVRSQPHSRWNTQFNAGPVRVQIERAGIRYVFLGEELGGRPSDPGMYDDTGHVLYAEVARSERFLAGLERLTEGAGRYRVAMMCSEEDPTDCHRRLLITRVLAERGVRVTHLRGDGTFIDEDELARRERPDQPTLFGGEERPWRSTRSVSPGTPPRSSSDP